MTETFHLGSEDHQPDTSADLIVIGGGIHGLMAALLAAEGGARVILLEQGQLGGATSAAWFGILHGGLRYLQNLDIARLRQSMSERRWLIQRFPEAIRSAPFLMPLYGQGMKRTSVFRAAFLAEALLTPDRNRHVPARLHMPTGRVVTATEVERRYPQVPAAELEGGALWHEAVVPDRLALITTIADAARDADARLICDAKVVDVSLDGATYDVSTSDGRTFHAPAVLNAAGPWARSLARLIGDEHASLPATAMGFNLELDREAPSTLALALQPPGQSAMLFMQPKDGRIFAGTWYVPAPSASSPDAVPAERDVADFIAALNASCPGLDAGLADIRQITAGHLPAIEAGGTDLCHHDTIHRHSDAKKGPGGVVSMMGVKFTTARAAARRALDLLGVASERVN